MMTYGAPSGLREDESILVLVDDREGVWREQPYTVRCIARLQTSGAWRAVATNNWWRLDASKEGVNWARGWETPAANALRVRAALL
jgi:hypothetical protein